MKVLTNKGRRRLGIPGCPAIILGPGDSVPISDIQLKDMRGNKTVSRWLDHGVLGVADHDSPVGSATVTEVVKTEAQQTQQAEQTEQELPADVSGAGVEIRHSGGGWYEVYVNGFKVTDSNVRKAEAEETAAEYK